MLKPALSSTNGHWRRNRQLDSLRTLSSIPATLVEHGDEIDPRIDGHGVGWCCPRVAGEAELRDPLVAPARHDRLAADALPSADQGWGAGGRPVD